MSRSLAVALALCAAACTSAPTPDVPSEPARAAHEPVAPSPSSEPDAMPVPAPQPEPAVDRTCPAPDHGSHCLWMATRPPNPVRAQHVAKRMKADGFDAIADGDRIIVRAGDDQLAKLFGVAVGHELRAASSSDRQVCVAALPEAARLSPRYAGEVGDFVLDDPTCEM